MSRIAVRPYLIVQDAEGTFRITRRTTRLNSQGYPLVTSTALDVGFPTLYKARAYVRAEFGIVAADIATK
jgi:hypothetical protein